MRFENIWWGAFLLILCSLSLKAEEPLFTFVQITDPHVGMDERGGYPGKNRRLEYVVSEIGRETNFPLPQFVVITGDIAEGEVEDLQTAKEILDRLPCPYYPVVGNHELTRGRQAWEKVFGKERWNYTFVVKGILFVAIDFYGLGFSTPFTERSHTTAKWLEGVLSSSKDKPVIILVHAPLFPPRDSGIVAYGLDLSGTELAEVVEKSSARVWAVLSGHTHVVSYFYDTGTGIGHVGGVPLVSGFCGYRHFSVYGDRIEVKSYQVPSELRIGQDWQGDTDGFHGKDNYAFGLPKEHEFIIWKSAPPEELKTIKEEKFYREEVRRRSGRPWMVIGPFPLGLKETPELLSQEDPLAETPPGFLFPYPPEKEINLQGEYQGKAGKVRWRTHYARLVGSGWYPVMGLSKRGGSSYYLSFLELMRPKRYGIAYALSYYFSPQGADVQLRVGSDDGIRLWLNNSLVLSHNIGRGAGPDQEIVPVKLLKGWNKILVKVEQGWGGWSFFLRFADEQGTEIPGGRWSINPEEIEELKQAT